MMTVSIICAGKTREAFIKSGIEEYQKRLSPYLNLKIEEAVEERIPENASPLLIEDYRRREGMRLLAKVAKDSDLVVLDPQGKMWSSEDLAGYLHRCALSGKPRVSFLIGGVYGHCPQVREQAKEVISFSRMTFNHQIIRLMLLEQLYRASRINRNEPYHR
jgi:23S rRNA (pseudouridine1915-N3)-methyltransferase